MCGCCARVGINGRGAALYKARQLNAAKSETDDSTHLNLLRGESQNRISERARRKARTRNKGRHASKTALLTVKMRAQGRRPDAR
eukprot:4732984-Alexandrium_andersonii.AAC.1